MESNRLLLIGGGGHCSSVADCLPDSFQEIGIVGIDSEKGKVLYGIRVVGCDDDMQHLYHNGWKYAFITIGSVGQTARRREKARELEHIGFRFPTVMDTTAVVSGKAEISEGAFIGKRACVNTNCRIGRHVIINTGAILDHGCTIGDFAHISPGAVLCGDVIIGDDSHVGAGSVVKQGVMVGRNVLIGAGSVVLHDLPDNVLAYGNPCRIIEERTE